MDVAFVPEDVDARPVRQILNVPELFVRKARAPASIGEAMPVIVALSPNKGVMGKNVGIATNFC
jgi:hypothetical protein